MRSRASSNTCWSGAVLAPFALAMIIARSRNANACFLACDTVAGYADWAVVSPLKLRSKVPHQFIVPCLLCALASKIRQRDDHHNCDHRGQ
jgi:hypothetical protein